MMMRICAGSVITNSWGDCDLSSSTTSCQAESLSLSSCSTPAGDCVFPFRHGGVVYQTCTTVDTGLSWCSTAVTDQGDHVPGTEGSCPASCDSTSTSTTAPTTSTSTSSTTSSTSTGCTPGQLSTVECNTCVCNSLGQQVTVYHQLLPSYLPTTTTTTFVSGLYYGHLLHLHHHLQLYNLHDNINNDQQHHDNIHHDGSSQQLCDGVGSGHRESLRVSLHVQQCDLRLVCRVGVRGHQSGREVVQHQGGHRGCSRQWRGSLRLL